MIDKSLLFGIDSFLFSPSFFSLRLARHEGFTVTHTPTPKRKVHLALYPAFIGCRCGPASDSQNLNFDFTFILPTDFQF